LDDSIDEDDDREEQDCEATETFLYFFSFPWLESASWVINTISQNMFTTRTRNHHDIQASLAWISH
jgi:hypothetical protein